MSELLEIPECTVCTAKQIKILRHGYENCHWCEASGKRSRLIVKKYLEVSE